ncbi:MAG TPA: hypothetical protein VGX94_14155 [Terriglobia bacterium]|nr:hypothetical protein [Terriglobia bacterium]
MHAAAKPVQDRFQEMPGPNAAVLRNRESLNQAMLQLHQALMPFVEGLPMEDGNTATQFKISQKIKGDALIVIFRPGASE